MIKIIDSCRTLEVLNQDSGLLPKPRPDWNTFEPKKGMIAHVDEDNSFYQFNGQNWIKVDITLEDELRELEEYVYEEIYNWDN